MDMIQKMPHVCADLEELSRRGANRERVVGFLETIVIARTSFRTGKTLNEREATLRKRAEMRLRKQAAQLGFQLLPIPATGE